MFQLNRTIIFTFLIFALPLAALAQIGGNGWKTYPVKFNVQSPTNAPRSDRYFVTNAPLPTYHCLVYSTDGAFSVGNTTSPRTEQRFTPDYTNGEIQYQAMLMCPSNENSYCCFQIHTGDAQSPAFGSTTFMIFWFTNNGGSVHDYSSSTPLASNLGNRWFQLNFDHNVVTRQIRVWVNGKQVWAQQDNGAGDFYMKDGVYEQSHNPTYQMDTYITNILMWTNSGVTPPPAPTNLVASPTATKIPLTWFTAWDKTNFTFNVKRATTSGGPYTTLTNLHGTTYTDTNVAVGTNYYYVVSAIDQFGESSNSMQAAASLFNLGFQLSVSPSSIAMNAGISTNFTVTMTTNSIYSGTTTLGVSGLPSGATANFSPPTLSAPGNSTLTINTISNTSSGSYVLTISGTNGANVFSTTASLTLTGISANPGTLVWTGNGADTNWSTILDWTNMTAGAFGPPGTNNSLIFTNAGAVSASALTSPGSGVVVPVNVNSFVGGNYSVIGLTNFANAVNASPIYQNLQIADGATLTAGGMQIGSAGITTYDFGANNVVNMTVSGSAGATLLVTNGGVTISQGSGSPGAHTAMLDLSGLDNFILTGTQLKLGIENITRAGGIVYLAKTNSITIWSAGYVNTDGSGSPYSGNPALTLGHNKSNLGNGAQLYLGVANVLAMDYATIGRGDANDLMEFNPAFLAQNPSVTIQGTNSASSRVGVYVVGDDSPGQGGSTSNTNDFSGGTVNALINYLCVGRGREGANETSNCNGLLTFDNGSINANTLAIGFLYPSGSNSVANGTVNVNGGTLTVVTNITIASRPNVGGSGSTTGTLNVNGGTIFATNISGGGGPSAINLNSGILNLQSSGQITNVFILLIGDGVSDSALLTGAAKISSPNAITIAANGTLAGNTIITTPNLIVNGTLAPGTNGIGVMTNNGAAIFGGGGAFSVTIQNANGAPTGGWDFLQINGALTVSASSGNPFTIQLESFDPNGSGTVTNFNSLTNYDWTIATASGGIANFGADKFFVDASDFQNDLNGGYFYVHVSGNSLVLSFTNPPPVPMAVHISPDGNNFIFSGSNGTAGAQYFVLSSTNVALPPALWTVIATNNFDGNGNFIFTNNFDANSPLQFYLLQLQ